MVSKNEINETLNKMILSASGWRGVFADGEESKSEQISGAYNIICAAAAFVFANYLGGGNNAPIVLLGADTRPTGKAIVNAMIPVLAACGCDVRYAGVTCAPEIMAWARSMGTDKQAQTNGSKTGFIYITASHNPIGHNGIKFGLTDGGVLAAEEADKLITAFRVFLERKGCVEKIENHFSAANREQIEKVYAGQKDSKAAAKKAYFDFCGEVVWDAKTSVFAEVKEGLAKKPLGIVCDFNGSARTASIDRDFFIDLGGRFECINDTPGQIVHRIVPEGGSLEPCCKLLEETHASDPSFILGYMPDCDGDRGNLVI
jgi:phosphoglucomutase